MDDTVPVLDNDTLLNKKEKHASKDVDVPATGNNVVENVQTPIETVPRMTEAEVRDGLHGALIQRGQVERMAVGVERGLWFDGSLFV